MTAQRSNAYVLSAVMHAMVAAILLFFSYELSQQGVPTNKIIELVAGVGDNYGATVAPALGTSGGSPSADSPLPNIARQFKNKMMRADLNAKKEVAKERAAEEKAVALAKQMTYDEAMKQNATKPPTTASQQKISKIDAEGIRDGVLGGSTANKEGGANGKALTSEGGAELDRYFEALKNQVKANFTQPPGVSDRLSARVEFFVSASGSISQVKIIRTSGNAEFDQAVKEAFTSTRMSRPRPDKKGDLRELVFKLSDGDGG